MSGLVKALERDPDSIDRSLGNDGTGQSGRSPAVARKARIIA
jgi:hypothetical protein